MWHMCFVASSCSIPSLSHIFRGVADDLGLSTMCSNIILKGNVAYNATDIDSSPPPPVQSAESMSAAVESGTANATASMNSSESISANFLPSTIASVLRSSDELLPKIPASRATSDNRISNASECRSYGPAVVRPIPIPPNSSVGRFSFPPAAKNRVSICETPFPSSGPRNIPSLSTSTGGISTHAVPNGDFVSQSPRVSTFFANILSTSGSAPASISAAATHPAPSSTTSAGAAPRLSGRISFPVGTNDPTLPRSSSSAPPMSLETSLPQFSRSSSHDLRRSQSLTSKMLGMLPRSTQSSPSSVSISSQNNTQCSAQYSSRSSTAGTMPLVLPTRANASAVSRTLVSTTRGVAANVTPSSSTDVASHPSALHVASIPTMPIRLSSMATQSSSSSGSAGTSHSNATRRMVEILNRAGVWIGNVHQGGSTSDSVTRQDSDSALAERKSRERSRTPPVASSNPLGPSTTNANLDPRSTPTVRANPTSAHVSHIDPVNPPADSSSSVITPAVNFASAPIFAPSSRPPSTSPSAPTDISNMLHTTIRNVLSHLMCSDALLPSLRSAGERPRDGTQDESYGALLHMQNAHVDYLHHLNQQAITTLCKIENERIAVQNNISIISKAMQNLHRGQGDAKSGPKPSPSNTSG